MSEELVLELQAHQSQIRVRDISNCFTWLSKKVASPNVTMVAAKQWQNKGMLASPLGQRQWRDAAGCLL